MERCGICGGDLESSDTTVPVCWGCEDDPSQADRWCAAGAPADLIPVLIRSMWDYPAELHPWFALGFSYQDLGGWAPHIDIDERTPEGSVELDGTWVEITDLAKWKTNGFTPAAAMLWVRSFVFDADEAAIWRDKGYNPQLALSSELEAEEAPQRYTRPRVQVENPAKFVAAEARALPNMPHPVAENTAKALITHNRVVSGYADCRSRDRHEYVKAVYSHIAAPIVLAFSSKVAIVRRTNMMRARHAVCAAAFVRDEVETRRQHRIELAREVAELLQRDAGNTYCGCNLCASL